MRKLMLIGLVQAMSCGIAAEARAVGLDDDVLPGIHALQDPAKWTEAATRIYYNKDLRQRWRREMGDATTSTIGTIVVAKSALPSATLRVAVTGNDFLLRSVAGPGNDFHSRQSDNTSARPVLIVNGSARYSATRDTYLSTSTVVPLGSAAILRSSYTMLVAFDSYTPRPGDTAQLQLTLAAKSRGEQAIAVHKPHIQADYPDITAVGDGRVIAEFTGAAFKPSSTTKIANGVATGSMGGKSLTALNQIFRIPPGKEYFLTVVMKLGSDWPTTGGKLPGLANTGMGVNSAGTPMIVNGTNCGRAGWGGRVANGCRWSARTGWAGREGTQIGAATYYYAENTSSQSGRMEPMPSTIEAGRWFAYVQRVKLNDVGESNGRLSYWMCGTLQCLPQYDRNDIRWRSTGLVQSEISEIWANAYCGGTSCGPAPYPSASASIKRLTVTAGLPDLAALLAEVKLLNR